MRTTILMAVLAFSAVATADETRLVVRSSAGDEIDSGISRMWDVFGRITDGAVARWGNEPAYFEWLALKLMWSAEEGDKQTLRAKLLHHPCSANGYVWSWGNEEGWPTHHARHYENNAKYILAVWRYCCWTRDWAFLNERDPGRAAARFPDQEDLSEGMTVLEKVREAMRFQLEELSGTQGLAVIEDGSATGTVDGKPSDYWDNFLFGYKSAYVNAYFHGSLLAMADLEFQLGDRERSLELQRLAGRVRQRFDETFWNPETGRYAGCVDVDGRVWDFGFTYLNLESVFYGCVPPARAREVFAWLDGVRTVPSDVQSVNGRVTGVTGADIYDLGWAPRSCTRAVESVAVDGKYWWWSINGAISVAGERPSARYGEHLENGGAIFYVSFYDIMARLQVLGAEAAWTRFRAILGEFAEDELRRDPPNDVGAAWKWGILGEFPESGLVPAAMVYGFLGLGTDHSGLTVAPRLPAALHRLELGPVVYGGARYQVSVQAGDDGFLSSVTLEGDADGGEPVPDRGVLTLAGFAPGAVCTVTRDGTHPQTVPASAEGLVRIPFGDWESLACSAPRRR